MIFIVVKFTVQPEHADGWIARTKAFTEATRAEPGNLWYEWSRSVDNPSEFVLVEAFRDQDAGVAHVTAPHFQAGLDAMRPALTRTPQILHTVIDADGWSEMGELQIEEVAT
ncbi:MAG: antibiotic biosynthesis monooxygenase [Actinobacteria bacterium]|nr:antibiotic biosynthesis monooxygenase [Actinomycetota bacterium]